jgi:antitoxin HicB
VIRSLRAILIAYMKAYSRTYTLSVEQHPEGYLAFFPALGGCATWGRTYEEAINNAEQALAVYLEALADLGKSAPEERDINKPMSLGVTVRVPVIA